VTLQPREVTGVCPFLDFSQQVDRFSLVARFAWIIDRHHHFDLYRSHVSIALDQASAFCPLTWNPHRQSSANK